MSWLHHVLAAEIVVVTGENDTIRFDDGTARTATLDPGSYCLYGNASETGEIGDGDGNGDILAEIKAKMEAVSARTYTLSYKAKTAAGGVTGEVVITQDSGSFHLDSASTFDMRLLGFPVAGQDDGGASVTSALSPWATWCADSPPFSLFERNRIHSTWQATSPSGVVYSGRRTAKQVTKPLNFRLVYWDRTYSDLTQSDSGRAFDTWLDTVGMNRFRLYRKEVSGNQVTGLTSTYLDGTWVLDKESLENYSPQNQSRGQNLYQWDILARQYVAAS